MKPESANEDFAPSDRDQCGPNKRCKRCEADSLHPEQITVAFPSVNGLVVVKNFPAMVCSTCGEEFVRKCTAEELRRMMTEGSSQEIISVYDYLRGYD